MGLDINGARLIVKAKSDGVSYEKVVTIGRQGLHLSAGELKKILSASGYQTADASKILLGQNGYSEPLFETLGASVIDSIDASEYENASIIHDMNLPIPDHLKGKYTAVVDGGTLEHVFNFPIAIKNCLELLETGGTYIGITPANNFFGHGFYQFSPELYFRIFNEENGFKIVRMLFYIDKKGATVYEVSDPNEVKSRVLLSNTSPSYLFIIAQRVTKKEIFSRPPLQSDYENISWKHNQPVTSTANLRLRSLVKKLVPVSIIQHVIKSSDFVKKLIRPTGTGKRIFFKKTEL
ncbi:hypothetical protein [Aridibaculum aurantiacum]|uniref:hypothetical protein n=1 Tax=Aridibaculum aurantiacum TaxID=2810307 RepID=UPI001A963781|nr:hypothetical protein [Aridibaculum aurantiacum]